MKARIMFTATEELEFIDSGEIKKCGSSYAGMNNPKRVIRQHGDVNPKEFKVRSVNVKVPEVPEVPGEYIMSSVLQCDGFTEDEDYFKIVVE